MNKRFKGIIADVLGLRESDIHLAMTKEEAGAWDSLKQLDMVMSLEREYDIELAISDIVTMTSVAKIVDVLKAKGVDLAD